MNLPNTRETVADIVATVFDDLKSEHCGQPASLRCVDCMDIAHCLQEYLQEEGTATGVRTLLENAIVHTGTLCVDRVFERQAVTDLRAQLAAAEEATRQAEGEVFDRILRIAQAECPFIMVDKSCTYAYDGHTCVLPHDSRCPVLTAEKENNTNG